MANIIFLQRDQGWKGGIVDRHVSHLRERRMIKYHVQGGAPLPEVGQFFAVLTPHVNRAQATNPKLELSPLITHTN